MAWGEYGYSTDLNTHRTEIGESTEGKGENPLGRSAEGVLHLHEIGVGDEFVEDDRQHLDRKDEADSRSGIGEAAEEEVDSGIGAVDDMLDLDRDEFQGAAAGWDEENQREIELLTNLDKVPEAGAIVVVAFPILISLFHAGFVLDHVIEISIELNESQP